MNKAILIGRLGADPEVRYMADGTPVANIRIATDESYRNAKGEKIERTEWHRVVLFSKLADVAKDYLSKGRLVMVEGSMKTRKWTDKDQVDRWTTEVTGEKIKMLDSRKAAEPEPEPEPLPVAAKAKAVAKAKAKPADAAVGDDGCPF